MSELQIRAAIASDEPTLVQFMTALQETERALHPNRAVGGSMAAAHVAYLQQLAQAHQGCVLIAEKAQPVGFLVGWVETLDEGDRHVLPSYRQFGYISDLYVEPNERRQGISRALLYAAADHFRRLELTTVRLSTLCANQAARAAYEHMGFQPYEIAYEMRL